MFFATAFLAARTLGGLDIFGGLSIKILIEHLPNYDIHYLQSLIGVAVAVDAHLYGYIMGILAQLVYWGVKAFKSLRMCSRRLIRLGSLLLLS